MNTDHSKTLLTDNKNWNKILWIMLSIVLVSYKFVFHELWKDEWQAWLVSRDMSLVDIFLFLNYEGHPSLWYLYLKIWTIFPLYDPTLIQMAHSILLVATLYYLYIRVHLPTIWKVLISLSYFVVYEYGIINRGYILVILLSFIAVDIISRERLSWHLGLVLLLLCQTEAYGVLIAGAITLYLLFSESGKSFEVSKNKGVLVWVIAGLLIFILTVYPRGNTDDFARAYNQDAISLDVIATSVQGHLANVFAIGTIDDTAANSTSTLGLLLSLIILLLLFYIFKVDRRIHITFLFGLITFVAFGIFIFSGGVRQWGMVYILFIVCLVLLYSKLKPLSLYRNIAITLMMILPVIHGVRGILIDIQQPFSNAEKVGHYIRDNVPIEVPIIAINKFETTPVSGYAERSFYELPSGATFTYFKWLEKVYIPTQEEITLFTRFKGVGGVVLISPKPIDLSRFPNAKLWQEFSEENFKKEYYWLYSIPLK